MDEESLMRKKSRNRVFRQSPLKSSSWESTSLYQISNGNPQKDTFHNFIFAIDKMVTFGIVNSTILMNLSLSKGVGGWRKAFKSSTIQIRISVLKVRSISIFKSFL